jgi:hypothetical protein
MQALIDFDGWRMWKYLSQDQEDGDRKGASAKKPKKGRSSMTSSTSQTMPIAASS